MIVSRLLAGNAVARGEKPSFVAAWLPVLVDLMMTVLLIGGTWLFVVDFFYHLGWPDWAEALAVFLALFIPFQAIIIYSTIWAVKSRWIGIDIDPDDGTKPDQVH